MSQNINLQKAKKAKNDEFYTKLTDIEKELMHYKEVFVGKTIYCNCDDPVKSNFVQWFYMRFNILHLKRIIVTAYNSVGCGLYWDSDFATVDPKSIDISKEIEKDVRNLNGDGDFRSDECIDLLKQADIVVSNPPFSLFREYVAQLMVYDKKFIIVGNQNAITYKEIFPLIKDNKMWLGYSIHSGDREFQVPDNYPITASGYRIDADGTKYIRVKGVRWFTNMRNSTETDMLILFRKYTPESYPKYDNYDAINVDKTCDIPADYDGVMGVPITFLDKYNPKQFKILGITHGRFDLGMGPSFRYENTLQHNPDGTTSNGSKINTAPCLLWNDKPAGKVYYTSSNREGYITPLYARILIRKIK